MVVQLRRSSENCAIVFLKSEDPCPSPFASLKKTADDYVIFPARTMCDIWSTWHKHELEDKHLLIRQEKQRDACTKKIFEKCIWCLCVR